MNAQDKTTKPATNPESELNLPAEENEEIIQVSYKSEEKEKKICCSFEFKASKLLVWNGPSWATQWFT